MEKTAGDTIQKYNMIQRFDNVIVALSGGADSVALFHFLRRHAESLAINLTAAHFEHGLRGQASRADEAFVRALCEEYNVPLVVAHGNMTDSEKPKGLGTEEWARQLRYAFLEGQAEAQNAKVALAHTRSDNAETVLFNAIRGAGPRGLAGIPPVRGRFVRPLLEVDRAGVEAYCKAHGFAYVTDATNSDVAYSRNRLRVQVLPQLEQAHPGAAQALARTAADMRELDAFLDEQAAAALQRAASCDAAGQVWYDAVVLHARPQPVRLKLLAKLAGPRVNRAALGYMEEVLWGRRTAVQLPGGAVFRRQRGRVCLVPQVAAGAAQAADAYEEPLQEGVLALPGGYTLTVRVCGGMQEVEQLKKTVQKGYLFAADCDKINNGVFRPRRAGDSFSPPGRGVTKPLKKWMNEAGILPKARQTLPLLAEGPKVLWVWGTGFCEGVAPDGHTKRILVLQHS